MEFKPFKIGKYLLLERLATGGMAEVYRAKASGAGGFEKQLAIKRILPTYTDNEEFRRMFEYEARLSSQLTHSNIVQIYDFVKSGDTYLLAMEYVDGKNLRQFVNKARKANVNFPVEFGAYVINEVCKGLEYAHKKKDDLNNRPLNIIHRDMSPQNIMLSYEGSVKIVDFGIAKAKDRVDETRSGVIKGKFGYMSPEQANGESVDHRTDIFSTGIILFEMLTGRRLFATDNDMATLKLIQECVIPTPSRLNPKINSDLEKIILKTLTKDLKLRFNAAGALQKSLQEYLNKYHPSYTQREVSDVLQKTFNDEIEHEKRRFEQIYRQSIPFSQGEQKKSASEFDEVEEALEGEDITKSEFGENTAVTFASEEENSGVEGTQVGEPEAEPNFEQGTNASDEPKADAGATKVESIFIDEDGSLGSLFGSIKEKKSSTKNAIINENTPGTGHELPTIPKTQARSVSVTPTRESTRKRPVGKPAAPPTPPPQVPLTDFKPLESSYSLVSPTDPDENSNEGPGPLKNEASQTNSVVLRNEETNPKIRRRDRSISAITHVEGTGSPQIENRREDSVSISLDRSDSQEEKTRVQRLSMEPARRRSADPYTAYPEREDYFGQPPSRSRTLLSFLAFCIGLGGTVYGYKVYLDNRVPELMKTVGDVQQGTDSEREPGEATPPEEKPEQRVVQGDCTIQVETDPAGAKILVGNQERGVTNTTISSPCNRAIDITLQMDGFEAVKENRVMKAHMERMYKTLKKIPMGTLELTLNRNAKIFIANKLVKEGLANQKIELSFRAGQKFSIRFVNEIFNIDTTREFIIEEDSVLRQTVNLEEGLPKQKGKNKRKPASDEFN